MRPVFVLDVAERSIDLLTRGRFIDDYCNVLTANGRTVKDDPDLTPEENEHKLFLAAVTEIQKDNDIRIADTAASLTTVIAQFYEQALKNSLRFCRNSRLNALKSAAKKKPRRKEHFENADA